MPNRPGPSAHPVTVLLVEDDRAHATIIRRAFERSPGDVDLRLASSLTEARALLATFTPDLAIVDLRLPDGPGTDLIASAGPHLPVVVMTSQGGEQAAVEVMKSGALDYVVKDGATLADMPHIAARALREWSHIVASRRAEEALRQSEARYRTLTEYTTDLIAELDDEGTVLFASPNHRELLGLHPDELVGSPAIERVHPLDRDALVASVIELMERGVAVDSAYRYRKGDDTWCWLESSARSYRTPSGEFRAVLTSRDVSDRRDLEEKLRQSQKLEAVGQLAGGVAHDFNNLLTVISGYGEVLIDALPPGSEGHEAARQICDAAERSAALTRQLLAFSRSQVLQPSNLDLNEIVSDLGKMLWRLLGPDIRLAVDLDPDIGRIEADRSQIEQIIVNLAVNARDAMAEGGELAIATTPGRAGFVRLSVRDSGHGMDEPTCERIFEPFFTTKQVGRGTGLGLSTVYGIVTQSGGHIAVESELGKGTRFDIELPAAASDTGIAAPADRTSPTSAPARGTILVVEDESRVRVLLEEALNRQGFGVVAVEDGERALAALSDPMQPVDLLLTDVVMPGVDGVTLADRACERRTSLKVVFMSGFTDHPGSLAGRPLPSDATLIRKPFRMGDLVAAIHQALGAS
jgi:PAS domain S-box-containing protein